MAQRIKWREVHDPDRPGSWHLVSACGFYKIESIASGYYAVCNGVKVAGPGRPLNKIKAAANQHKARREAQKKGPPAA